jgi:class 3 adenylate cyclase
MSQTLDALQDARDAAGRQAWRAAFAAYSEVDSGALTGEDHELFGEAAWWSGKLEQAIAHRERAYSLYSAENDRLGAARLALVLSWDNEARGAFAVARGWLANAERLLENAPEAPEHAQLALLHAIGALFGGDLPRAVELFDEAYERATQVGSRDGQMLALSGKGRALVKSGEIDAGLALLDEATASAMCGDLRAHTAGLVYCITISSCQDVGDFRRAAEWTEAANRWCDKLDVSGFPGACRIHRAEALRLRGDWPAAEAQAVAACEELHDFDRFITANGHYEIGEIRRRRGDFAGAEEEYATANELGRDPEPGLSLLRLAEGKVVAAVAGITRTLQDAEEPLVRLQRLPAQVQIVLAAGDVETARSAADEAEGIVDSYKIANRRTPAFDATVHFARGEIQLAEQDWSAAISAFKHSRDEWKAVGAPYETARARMHLGIARTRSGDEHGGASDLEGALATFEQLGARVDAARIEELLGRSAAKRTFLFTDIVDSTRLLETLGDEKWRRLLARHDDLVRSSIAEGGGEVVKHTGDGFFASFESAKGAVEAAIAIQRALAEEIVAPDVRIGIHSGEAFRTGNDGDYGGQGVHVAARIGAAASAGEILASTETLDGMASFRLSNPRSETLKGVQQPVDVVVVDWR